MTDHPWTPAELFAFKVPPPCWLPPTRRGRPSLAALQLAQRSPAETIDAIEIDEAAYEQCADNFENSPWADRLFCYHASIQEFATEIDEQYDLIVSNPPFYTEDFKTSNAARDMARFNDAMPFDHLLICVATLLAPNGIFSLIIPRTFETEFLQLAAVQQLYPLRICRVKGTPDSEEKRSMIELGFTEHEAKIEHLVIETSRHQYTEAYTALVSDFYLKM
ncbi:MAG: methyltransferase [Marinirhabdus sp.]|nr:methyltransferase [Marinirhabdus sp.]